MILSCVTCGDPCQSPRTTCGKTGCLSESRKPKRIARLGKKKAEALALAGKPWPRSSITASRKAPRKRKRKPSETLRIYGTPERRAWMKTLPCSACGIVGYSEGAHVLGNGGMGRKKDADTQAPLCGPHEVMITVLYVGSGAIARESNLYMGCHRLYDRHRWQFNARFPDFNSEQAARTCELAWQDHLTGESA